MKVVRLALLLASILCFAFPTGAQTKTHQDMKTEYIADACKGASVGKGLAMKGTVAQKSQDSARKSVQSWLEKIDLAK